MYGGETVTAPHPPLRLYPHTVLLPVLAALMVTTTIYIWFTDVWWSDAFSVVVIAILIFASIKSIRNYNSLHLTASADDEAVVLNGDEFPFDLIESVAVKEWTDHDVRGRLTAVGGRLDIAMDGERHIYHWASVGSDRIAPLVQHVLQRMADEMRHRPLPGEGWSFDGTDLLTARDLTPLSTLSHAAVYDDQVRLWRWEEVDPFFSVPKTSPNALLLLRLAQRAARPAQVAGLGRFLFTRKPSPGVAMFYALVAGGIAFLITFESVDRWAPQMMKQADLACGVFTLLLLVRALLMFGKRYDFYERGVEAIFLGSRRELFYADVARATWRRMHHRIGPAGAYIGTSTRLRLYPVHGRPMHIRVHRFHMDDPDLDRVRQTIAAAIQANKSRRTPSSDLVPAANGGDHSQR
jgi:hypothetical protein